MMDAVTDATPVIVPAWATRRRFDVFEYHRMGETGILGEDDPFELIDGEIIEMASIGTPHIGAVMALGRILILASGNRYLVSTQNPLRLDNRNEPEPDLVLLRPRPDGYRVEPPPGVDDAVLVIEVSDSSLRYDREVKARLYARYAIPELWIVDLAAGEVELYRAPAGGTYGHVTRAGRGDVIAPLALPEARVLVADITPP